jgi:hypothetical protein
MGALGVGSVGADSCVEDACFFARDFSRLCCWARRSVGKLYFVVMRVCFVSLVCGYEFCGIRVFEGRYVLLVLWVGFGLGGCSRYGNW